jgi:hypothetical protein
MTQGFLLFAHDNEEIQYGLLAAWQAQRIKKWLGKPVSLVTDEQTLNKIEKFKNLFDHIILSEVNTGQKKSYQGTQLTFKNVDRSAAWDLTPYDETIIIDTDIVIQSDRLNLLWNHSDDFLVCKQSEHILGRKFTSFDWVSNYGIKFYWATVFYFKKSPTSKLFLDHCQWIKQHYNWYGYVNDLTTKYIRNDHVWSIALHDLGGLAGSSWAQTTPCNLYFSLEDDKVINMDDTSVTILGQDKLAKVIGCDLHIMNKVDLLKFASQELEYE